MQSLINELIIHRLAVENIMNKFTVHRESRQRWAWEVRCNGGITICRADTRSNAERLAMMLNRSRDRAGLNDPLTREEIATLDAVFANLKSKRGI